MVGFDRNVDLMLSAHVVGLHLFGNGNGLDLGWAFWSFSWCLLSFVVTLLETLNLKVNEI